MFIKKEKYFFYINNTKSINLNLIKKKLNIAIIYRNYSKNESLKQIIKFRKDCKQKKYKFYIANDFRLAKKCKSDGLYLSAFNKKYYHNIELIGSAHNFKEISQKIKQNCKTIFLSRLFNVSYKLNKSFFGVIKFNLILKMYNVNIIPLGGIKNDNLLSLNLLNCNGIAIFREIKKKPAITSRLFN